MEGLTLVFFNGKKVITRKCMDIKNLHIFLSFKVNFRLSWGQFSPMSVPYLSSLQLMKSASICNENDPGALRLGSLNCNYLCRK